MSDPRLDKVWADTAAGRYADIAPCGRCGKDVVLDHDPPCEHSWVACPECTHAAVCVPCRIQAEQDMHESGDYDPAKDPLFDHTAETVKPFVPPRETYFDGIRIRYRDTNEEVAP